MVLPSRAVICCAFYVAAFVIGIGVATLLFCLT
jgi:hypothetical protein